MKKVILNSSEFSTREQLHCILKEKLNLPEYYGCNLDALWDCLTGWVELPIVVEWNGFEESKKTLGDYAEKVAAVFKDAEQELEDFKLDLR